MTIEEGNEIIAVHEGWEKWYGTLWKKGKYHRGIAGIKYHNDWSWIIPVVQKLLKDTSNTSDISTPYKRDMMRDSIQQALLELDIEKLWYKVVEVIKEIQNK